MNVGLTVPAHADSFYLKNGQVIDGQVLKGTMNTLALRSRNAVRLASITQIDRVVLNLADGSELAGEWVGWSDGVFQIRSAGKVLRVADGQVLSKEGQTRHTIEATSPLSLTMDGLPAFALNDGETLVGDILYATESMLTVRSEAGSVLPVLRAQIEAISFDSADGDAISGKLIGWEKGVYRLKVDAGELLATLGGGPVKAEAPSLKAASEDSAVQPLDTPVATEIEQMDAAVLPSGSSEQPGDGSTTLVPEETRTSDAVDEPGSPEAADDAAQHRIETLVEAVDEGADAAIVKFQLDKPAERPLVVLYAATDASAKAGSDFEAKSGVITFATGSTYAEVQVPIIDDDKGENREEFNLFLSGDPKTITFDGRQITVTINDDD
ncbi:MAG: Calx-beta domain-containing protein [Geminicoccaceae bacterium]